MTKIVRFEDIESWKMARLLTKDVYLITYKELFRKDFGLADQIRRAAVSVMSNIAEGFERRTNKEFIQFLYISKGSAGEVRSQLYTALDLKYINEKEFQDLYSRTESISQKISAFIKYLDSCKQQL
jgi:four helix bundle protein